MTQMITKHEKTFRDHKWSPLSGPFNLALSNAITNTQKFFSKTEHHLHQHLISEKYVQLHSHHITKWCEYGFQKYYIDNFSPWLKPKKAHFAKKPPT